MKLRPIDRSASDVAWSLLVEGFPERAPEFWREGLDRLLAHGEATGSPVGQLMMVRDEPAGIILTIPGHREDQAGINLSSWYVRAKHRWLAPRMLQMVTADPDMVYTDLSPSVETLKINEHLGFRTVSEAVTVFPLPVTAVAGRSEAEIVPCSSAPLDIIDAGDRLLMERHRDLGCLCAVAVTGRAAVPMIFTRTVRKHLPVARLVYASDRRIVGRAAGAIARFLLQRGLLVMTMHSRIGQRMRGGIQWKTDVPVQVKGSWNSHAHDQTFSEAVFLRL